ncbi:hypothetical protein [Corynebacterium diphtheriae]|uniref:Transposase n=1 Tax=Corynebacterium diphtheriae bv. gravis TaxID=1720349 RepID=A0AAX0J1W4_CORDP|nr:hypothetical protein [Corynebacterium diphtheriae]AEX68224.1 hypothetical protein CDC7B_2037 [Corynebacterium diphtheriae C7 (beta)]OKY22661.1 hypothetical protein AOT42_10825 [Corynebacterium diphtheriae bv. gravis]UEB34976.1 hypothetical protein LK418_10350 [Corynebacterium diphtheriae subsp. diphtheriae]UFX13904.1 hypothetical protein LRM94_09830 [Corynebacterium diphtheriae]WJY88271.1 hypothetical protein CDIPH_10040 [Corynebacterium diphtheriae]
MLGWWLKARRVELDAVQQSEATPDELKAEIRKLRRDIATLKMENEFLGKASAFFAAKQQNKNCLS